jgi:hypothetical protein
MVGSLGASQTGPLPQFDGLCWLKSLAPISCLVSVALVMPRNSHLIRAPRPQGRRPRSAMIRSAHSERRTWVYQVGNPGRFSGSGEIENSYLPASHPGVLVPKDDALKKLNSFPPEQSKRRWWRELAGLDLIAGPWEVEEPRNLPFFRAPWPPAPSGNLKFALFWPLQRIQGEESRRYGGTQNSPDCMRIGFGSGIQRRLTNDCCSRVTPSFTALRADWLSPAAESGRSALKR